MTPPVALLVGFLAETRGIEIGFGEWMLVGVPVAGLLLVLAWLVLGSLAVVTLAAWLLVPLLLA